VYFFGRRVEITYTANAFDKKKSHEKKLGASELRHYHTN
jgi:hypothetical protein